MIFFAAVAIGIVLLVWSALLWWVKQKSERLINQFYVRIREAGEEIEIRPQSCLYRGSENHFSNVRGNGIICLTNNRLMFEKLTGQRIEIDRTKIAKATLEEQFRGETTFATRGDHLVVETTDSNRIGFLVRDAGLWIEKLATHSAR